jgi:hypothetical protein
MGGNFGTQHLTGGDLHHAVALFQPPRLGALARAWWSQQYQIHS